MMLRRSFPLLASLLFVATCVLPGCPQKTDTAAKDDPRKKKEDDDDKKGKKKKKGGDDDDDKTADSKKKKKGDDDDDDDKGSAKKKGDDDDDDDKGASTKKKKSGDGFTASIEGQDVEFKFAKASAGYSGLEILLSSEKIGCSGSPSDDAWTVSFTLSPGPGGHFFAGKKPTGVPVYINSQRLKLKMGSVSPYLANATIEAFKLAEGEHVKGTLDFDSKWKDYTSKKDFKYTGSGGFDAVICKDWQDFKMLAAQPDSVDDGPVKGTYGKEKFEYKSALAVVYHDENNNVDYVDEIDLFPSDKVTCAARYDQRDKDHFFFIRAIGGAGSKKPILNAPQSADPTFSIPEISPGSTSKKPSASWKMFGGSSRRAWVTFDALSFGNGDKISGEIYADSIEAKPEQTGKMSGKFEATVCKGF